MKNILSFLLCLFVAAVLTYEVSGRGGIFVLFLLGTAVLFSLAMLIVSALGIRTELSLSTGIVNKGDNFTAHLDVNKKSFLPSSFIEVTFGSTPNIGAHEEGMTYKFICSKLYGETVDIDLDALLCGRGEVYVKKIVLSDYLGLFSKKLNVLPERCSIKILPGIPDTGSQTEVIKSASENISFDDSDEESDEISLALTGVPGYEHRDYVPGDPLKRINWKLSSKKDQLMVRLDEKVTSSSQVMRLDLVMPAEPDKIHYTIADTIIESALALLSMLVMSGYESEFNFCLDGEWVMVEVNDEKSLTLLQDMLGGAAPYTAAQRIPDHDINIKGKAMMCFTTCTADMAGELAALTDGLNGSLVIARDSGIGAVRQDMWTVSKEFEFTKLS